MSNLSSSSEFDTLLSLHYLEARSKLQSVGLAAAEINEQPLFKEVLALQEKLTELRGLWVVAYNHAAELKEGKHNEHNVAGVEDSAA